MMAKYEEDYEEERIIRVASLVEKFESEIKKQTDLKSAVKTIQMCQVCVDFYFYFYFYFYHYILMKKSV